MMKTRTHLAFKIFMTLLILLSIILSLFTEFKALGDFIRLAVCFIILLKIALEIFFERRSKNNGSKDISTEISGVIVSLRAAALLKRNQYLLMQRKVGDDFYAPIGGRIKVGETSENALKRELNEELALNLKIKEMVIVLENFVNINNKNYHEISFIYDVECVDELLKNGERFVIEDIEFRWISTEEIRAKEVEIKPEILKAMKHCFSGKIQHLINIE